MTTAATAISVGAGPTIAELIDSWELALRAANKSDRTLETYLESGRQFAKFLASAGMPTQADRIAHEHVEHWVVSLQATKKPATVSVRYRGLQSFFRWATAEREVPTNPMQRMVPPFVPEARVVVPSDDDITKLFKACSGSSFEQVRDLAIFRLLADSGIRANELIGLRVADVDLKLGTADVTGKGRRPRKVPVGRKASAAIDKYRRVRSRHPGASSPMLWIGQKGPLTTSGLRQLFERRCDQAGIPRIHPHQLRHSFVDSSLKAGANETDVMTLAGWKSRAMLQRYASMNASDRAIAAHRSFSPGDRL